MTDYPECSCPNLGSLARAGLEGQDIAACDIHRPDHRGDGFGDATPLNSDHLIAGLGDHSTTL